MDEKQVTLIKKALNDTASHLRPGSAGAKSVRNSALSLILTEEQGRQPLSSMSEAELADLMKFNKRLVDIAGRFLGQTMALPLTPEQTALLMTFYLALDGYGPAANVTGDGAIAIAADRFFGPPRA